MSKNSNRKRILSSTREFENIVRAHMNSITSTRPKIEIENYSNKA
jgi:hypothetical protein